MPKQMLKKITNRNLLILLGSAAAVVLVIAYVLQYFFGVEACQLCFYQRKLFLVIIAAVALTLTYFKSEKSKRIALYICTIALVLNFLTALYHSGVEKKIFATPVSCSSSQLGNISTLEELKAALMTEKAASCDEPKLVVFGLSLANFNAIYCFLLLSYIAFVRYQRRK